MKWIDYLILAWLFIFIIVSLVEIFYGQISKWTLFVYLIVWCGLMIIKTFINKKTK